MDPDAVLKDFRDALESGDRASAQRAMRIMGRWLARGGFAPEPFANDAECLDWMRDQFAAWSPKAPS